MGLPTRQPGGEHGAVQCTHCGLPVPAGLVEAGAAEQFCCNGCRTVYAVLRDEGLDTYYDLRESAGEQGQKARTTDKTTVLGDNPQERTGWSVASGVGLTQATTRG